MGKKDDCQFDYLDDNKRFADQINGALFGGRQMVKPEELEAEEAQTISLLERAGDGNVKVVVDKVRVWRGTKLHVLAVENQNYVDYRMVLRSMLSESLGYNRQWRQKKRAHEEAGDLKRRDEYLSGMRRDEKFTPIITLVVHFGMERSWDGARCLHDLLDIDDELKGFVTNYQLNLYDCQEHDTFIEYCTGLRQVFETIRYAKDKKRLMEVMEESREAYSRIDADTRRMLEVMANVRIPETFKVEAEGEERYDMCKAFEDMRLEGYEEGMEKAVMSGIEKLVKAVRDLGASKAAACEQLIKQYALEESEANEKVEMHWAD